MSGILYHKAPPDGIGKNNDKSTDYRVIGFLDKRQIVGRFSSGRVPNISTIDAWSGGYSAG
jgi:hypothetical protein